MNVRSLKSRSEAPSTCATKSGVFLRGERGEMLVEIDGERFEAKRAVSCLVEPEERDRVLVAVDSSSVTILAILEREAGAPVRLSSDGDMVVALKEGRFAVVAQKGIELFSGEKVKVAAKAFDISAGFAELVLRSMRVVGEEASVHLERTNIVSRFVDAVHERISQKTERSIRVVGETDVLRADAVDYQTSNTMRMHAKNAVVTASDLVKMDGKQIHLG
jgi:hypothetical protein